MLFRSFTALHSSPHHAARAVVGFFHGVSLHFIGRDKICISIAADRRCRVHATLKERKKERKGKVGRVAAFNLPRIPSSFDAGYVVTGRRNLVVINEEC